MNPCRNNSLHIIGNFREFRGTSYQGPFKDHKEVIPWSGIRGPYLAESLANALEPYFSVDRIDITDAPCSSYEHTIGLSNALKSYDSEGLYLYIQNHTHYTVDIPIRIIYMHVDCFPSITPNQSVGGIRILHCEPYRINDKMLYLYPWIDPAVFNPNQEKDIFISDISREIPFKEYKDILERSCYTLIRSDTLGKRCLEAMACKTIPISIYNAPGTRWVYDLGKIDEKVAYITHIFDEGFQFILTEYDTEMAKRGYELVMKYHTIQKRIKKVVRFIKKYEH